MNKTDLVKSLGVEVNRVLVTVNRLLPEDCVSIHRNVIYLEDLQSALEKLPVVYGYREGKQFSQVQAVDDTHQARLICVEEIKREPLKVEKTVLFPENHKAYDVNGNEFGSVFAGKKVKIILEEVQS